MREEGQPGTEERIGIRWATVEDAGAIAQVHVSAWRAAYRGIVPAARLAALDVERIRLRTLGRLGSGERILVAVAGGEVIGFASLGAGRDEDSVPGRTGEVYALYLAPEHWHRGIGARLLQRALEELAALGYGEAVLWVLAANAPARRFYEAMGFTLDGTAKGIEIGTPLEEIRYRRALGAGA